MKLVGILLLLLASCCAQQKAIIVGASTGIGRELALQLVENGCRIGLCSRSLELLEDLYAQKPNDFVALLFGSPTC